MASLKTKFGKAIRRLRTEAGYSQEGFAAHAKIGRSYFGLIERGQVNVSLDNVEKISKALGLSVGRLFTEVDREG